MRNVVIKVGVYGRRDEKGRVLPVVKGERVTLSDAEAARLVALDVASYVEPPAKAPTAPLAPPPGGEEPPAPSQDTPSGAAPAEAATEGDEAELDEEVDSEVARLERMRKADLVQMAEDLGIDITGAKTNHALAVLIAAADEQEDGDTLPDLGVGDIVQ